MKDIYDPNYYSIHETVEEYIERYNRVTKAEKYYRHISTVDCCEEHCLSDNEMKKLARSIIKKSIKTKKGFNCRHEAKIRKTSQVRLKKFIIKELEGTGYELYSIPGKTIINKR